LKGGEKVKTRTSLVSLAVMLALSVGLVGCGGEQGPEATEYTLTISSAAGGSVTSPGEGTFTYDDVTLVDLAAEPEAGCYFVNWTGDVGTIANVNAIATTITMNDSYTITANFEAIPAAQYSLTISSATEGWLLCGKVTTPGEGTFSYSSGTVINLLATPEAGCYFVNWTGDAGTVADVNAATTTITINGDYSIRANFRSCLSRMLAAGGYHTAGSKSDGTVVAAGSNTYGQRDVDGWTDIIQVSAGCDHTVGLKSNGTVVAVGEAGSGRCNVGGWTDVTQLAAGGGHTIGLKSDGTVVAVGWNKYGQCNVGSRSWTDIIQVAGGWDHTVGLRSDGTVVAAGNNIQGQCNVGGWTDIIQVSAGYWHTVGLRTDGTVVAVGDNTYGQCHVVDWSPILQVAAGYWHTVGLKDDGTVIAVGDNYYRPCDVVGWTDIIHIAAGRRHTVGVRSDGTVAAVGSNVHGPCDVGGWDLF
jgi:hypothetical protein